MSKASREVPNLTKINLYTHLHGAKKVCLKTLTPINSGLAETFYGMTILYVLVILWLTLCFVLNLLRVVRTAPPTYPTNITTEPLPSMLVS